MSKCVKAASPTVLLSGSFVLVLSATLVWASPRVAQSEDKGPATKGPAAEAVAQVGETVVSASELDELLGNGLLALSTQAYEIRKRALGERIARMLLEREASRRGVSVEEIERLEIEQKARPVADDEVKAVYDSAKSNFAGVPEPQALERIRSGMRTQRAAQRRSQFVKGLEATIHVTRFLQPPRAKVGTDDDPSRGPETAPVTIVEFSDFECPYCSRAAATLKQIEETYGDKVRVVFRDFPLPLHRNAPKAAEAAQCARDQGKFWEMHDRLFANQKDLDIDSLRRYAGQIALDLKSFGECLDSGRHAAEWQKDKADGEACGVSGTPAFFVNGRFLSGSRPFDAFTEVIDDELARAGLASPQLANAVEARSAGSLGKK